MKTFALLFAFVPVILAYTPGGSIKDAPIFWTLALIWVGVEFLNMLRAYHSECSLDAIRADFDHRWHSACQANEFDEAREALNAHKMFLNRGAA